MNYKIDKLDIAGQKITNLAKDLLHKIFEKDPKKRISAKAVLEHAFFKDQDEDKQPISKEVQDRLG
jgi:serine/threonine protein kinase